MSHVAEVSAEAVIPLDQLYFLRLAIQNHCSGEVEINLDQTEYRNWVTDHGKLYGDFDPPAWLPESMIGKGAIAVIRMTDEKLQQLGKRRHAHGSPYEIGLVPVSVTRDSSGAIASYTYDAGGDHVVPVMDFFAQGHGLLECEGLGKHHAVKEDGKQVDKFAEIMMQNFQLERIKHAAKMKGDNVQVERVGKDVKVTVQTHARVGY